MLLEIEQGSSLLSFAGGGFFGGGDSSGGMSFATLAANQSDSFGAEFGKKCEDLQILRPKFFLFCKNIFGLSLFSNRLWVPSLYHGKELFYEAQNEHVG